GLAGRLPDEGDDVGHDTGDVVRAAARVGRLDQRPAACPGSAAPRTAGPRPGTAGQHPDLAGGPQPPRRVPHTGRAASSFLASRTAAARMAAVRPNAAG